MRLLFALLVALIAAAVVAATIPGILKLKPSPAAAADATKWE